MTGCGAKEGKAMNNKQVVVITDARSAAAEAIARRMERDQMIAVRNYPDGIPEEKKDTKHCFSFDTCSEAEMKKLLGLILEQIGDVNYLIHTDNIIFRSSIEEISEEDFKKYLDRNAKSAFFTTKVFGEHMAKSGKGAILYLSSLHDEKPTGCAFTYSAAKGAVKMLCKEAALFYGRKGIRVNLIEMDCTEDQADQLDSLLIPFHYDSETKIPLRRRAKPEDCAGAAAFLLSSDAAFINGAEIRIDGGHLLYYYDRL